MRLVLCSCSTYGPAVFLLMIWRIVPCHLSRSCSLHGGAPRLLRFLGSPPNTALLHNFVWNTISNPKLKSPFLPTNRFAVFDASLNPLLFTVELRLLCFLRLPSVYRFFSYFRSIGLIHNSRAPFSWSLTPNLLGALTSAQLNSSLSYTATWLSFLSMATLPHWLPTAYVPGSWSLPLGPPSTNLGFKATLI